MPTRLCGCDITPKVVQVVLGGTGSVRAVVRDEDGDVVDRVEVAVDGSPRAYPLVSGDSVGAGTVELSASEGVQAFSFTFG